MRRVVFSVAVAAAIMVIGNFDGGWGTAAGQTTPLTPTPARPPASPTPPGLSPTPGGLPTATPPGPTVVTGGGGLPTPTLIVVGGVGLNTSSAGGAAGSVLGGSLQPPASAADFRPRTAGAATSPTPRPAGLAVGTASTPTPEPASIPGVLPALPGVAAPQAASGVPSGPGGASPAAPSPLAPAQGPAAGSGPATAGAAAAGATAGGPSATGASGDGAASQESPSDLPPLVANVARGPDPRQGPASVIGSGALDSVTLAPAGAEPSAQFTDPARQGAVAGTPVPFALRSASPEVDFPWPVLAGLLLGLALCVGGMLLWRAHRLDI
jgi:hypothetical protein